MNIRWVPGPLLAPKSRAGDTEGTWFPLHVVDAHAGPLTAADDPHANLPEPCRKRPYLIFFKIFVAIA